MMPMQRYLGAEGASQVIEHCKAMRVIPRRLVCHQDISALPGQLLELFWVDRPPVLPVRPSAAPALLPGC